MSESNEATPTALISDFLSEKSLKTQARLIGTDSGFISSENLSENLTGDHTDNKSCENVEFSEVSDPASDTMKVEAEFSCVSEDFSKLKLANPFINDLSRNRKDRQKISKISMDAKDHHNFFEQDEDGDTYLHAAIAQCHPEIVLALIRSAPNSDYLDISNDEGFTPLHLAVTTGQIHIVRWLIVAGVQPGPRNCRGESPLHIAARLGNVSCCRAITEPVHCKERELLNLRYQVTCYKLVNLDQWDYEGQTCIHVAAVNGHIDVLRLLIWHGADINAREGKSGYTALHYAVESQNDSLAYFLLTECKQLDLETTNYAGRSVLQLGLPVNRGLLNVLLSKGVASSYSSDDEMMDESEDDISCQSSTSFMPQLVNSCA